MHLVFGRCRVPTCNNTCPNIEPLVCRRPCRPTFSGVSRKVAYDCLVWVSVRVLAVGRVEQRSNGRAGLRVSAEARSATEKRQESAKGPGE